MRELKFGTPVLIHDGAGHFRGGLVHSTRYDLGGPDDFPVVTGVAFDPRFAPTGPARGDIRDAIVTFHDYSYLDITNPDHKKLPGYTLNGEFFDDEIHAEVVRKPVVLPKPVEPVLVNKGDTVVEVPKHVEFRPEPVATVDGVRVVTEPTDVEGVSTVPQTGYVDVDGSHKEYEPVPVDVEQGAEVPVAEEIPVATEEVPVEHVEEKPTEPAA